MAQKSASISQLHSNGTPHPVMRSRPSAKVKITVSLPAPLIERLRNAVYWMEHRTFVSLIEEALEALATEMEAVNNDVFPQRLTPLKPGRRQRTRPSGPSALSPPQREPDLHSLAQGRHDQLGCVLQSLFAVGLTLQACKQGTSLRNGEPIDAQLQRAVNQLSVVIHEIRTVLEGQGSDGRQ